MGPPKVLIQQPLSVSISIASEPTNCMEFLTHENKKTEVGMTPKFRAILGQLDPKDLRKNHTTMHFYPKYGDYKINEHL